MVRLGSLLKERSEYVSHLLKTKLWLQVIIAMMLGITVGVILGPDTGFVNEDTAKVITNWLAFPGNLFLQLIKLIIIPLIFSSIIVGLISAGDPKFLKKIGPGIAIYFLITTIVAVLIGFTVATLISPGNYIDLSQTEFSAEVSQEAFDIASINIPEAMVNLLPSNPLESMVTGDMLGIVIFTIIFGVALLFVKKRELRTVGRFLEAIQHVSMIVVKWAMHLAPLAVFGLSTKLTSEIGLTAITGLAMYVLTVIVGLLILLLFYMLIIFFLTRRNPLKFMGSIKDVQLLAFSTSSSAAVMPLSIHTAEEKLKIKPAISRFLVPIGATINMDGTALYQVVATVFLAQVFGVHLTLASILLIAAITVGASIGAPSAPGVGIVILATILATVGIPAAGIALILGVDRILDMSRTAVNVTGDLTACSFFNKFFEKEFK